MLKMIRSPDVSRPEVKNGNSEVVGFGISGGSNEKLTKKSRKLSKGLKLSKSGNSKSKTLAKSKKPSKSRNLSNVGATEARPSFLTLGAREVFNRLQLAFTKAPILQYFDPKYHIWIKTNALGYTIGRMLSQVTPGTRPNKVVTKTDLSQ